MHRILQKIDRLRKTYFLTDFSTIPAAKGFPVDIGWDPEQRGYLISRNGTIEEYTETWVYRRRRYPGVRFGASPYMVDLGASTVCLPAGKSRLLMVIDREKGAVRRQRTFDFDLLRLYPFPGGRLMARCMDGSERVLVLDKDLRTLHRVDLGPVNGEGYGGAVRVTTRGEHTLVIIRNKNDLNGDQQIVVFDLNKERVKKTVRLDGLVSSVWDILSHGDGYLIGGNGFLACLDEAFQVVFQRPLEKNHVLNILRVIEKDRKNYLFAFDSVRGKIVRWTLTA
jgi:hypothetical protein